jgi:hypothetical protein
MTPLKYSETLSLVADSLLQPPQLRDRKRWRPCFRTLVWSIWSRSTVEVKLRTSTRTVGHSETVARNAIRRVCLKFEDSDLIDTIISSTSTDDGKLRSNGSHYHGRWPILRTFSPVSSSRALKMASRIQVQTRPIERRSRSPVRWKSSSGT